MGYSTTYALLQTVARQAAGLSAEALDADELALVAQAPNEAVEQVAQSRRWPRLVKDLSLSLASAATYVALPADFSAFERDSVLSYGTGVGYAPLAQVGYDEILVRRCAVDTTGPPELYAIGATATTGTEVGRLRLELWPKTDAAYTLVGSYRRQIAAMTLAADVPDLPLELHQAVRTATQMIARELFNQQVPEDWEKLLERRLERAWRILSPQLQSAAPLRPLRGGSRVESGRKRELAADFPYYG